MGIKNEREKFYKYKEVYNSLKFFYEKKSFRIHGKINEKDEIEVIARIFYKKIEEFLYSKEILEDIYESTIKKVLKMNNLLNKTLFDILKEKKFHFEAINILIIRIFDYVYYTIRKNMPYTKKLRVISKTIVELLENTYKYSARDFCITTCLENGEYPLVIKIDNRYDKDNEKMKKNIMKLQDMLEEINSFDDSNESFINVMKKRIDIGNENNKDSYLGLAKIRMMTGGSIRLSMDPNIFGENGITLVISIPIEIYSEKEIIDRFQNLIK
jgi:hypothetical protein